jgi:SAM-dependent methyltransferase
MNPDPIYVFLPPVKSGRNLIINTIQRPELSPVPVGEFEHCAEGQRVWSSFWREFAPENEPQERCYVPREGRVVVDGHWAHFATKLASGAQVIDLGCGAGTVGHTMLSHRRNLHVTGVDWANVPVINLANLSIHAGINMEALPFDAASFDAAVSLFGIEYGAIEKIAPELQRIMRPGGRFNFIVHHRDSETSREGCARRRALRALMSGKLKATFLAGYCAGLNRQRQLLGKHYPDEPMINLVSDYCLRNINGSRAERDALWRKLACDLEPEIVLLLHQERAAKSSTEIAAWIVPLIATMQRVSISVLHRGSGEPIAWNVSGVR